MLSQNIFIFVSTWSSLYIYIVVFFESTCFSENYLFLVWPTCLYCLLMYQYNVYVFVGWALNNIGATTSSSSNAPNLPSVHIGYRLFRLLCQRRIFHVLGWLVLNQMHLPSSGYSNLPMGLCLTCRCINVKIWTLLWKLFRIHVCTSFKFAVKQNFRQLFPTKMPLSTYKYAKDAMRK